LRHVQQQQLLLHAERSCSVARLLRLAACVDERKQIAMATTTSVQHSKCEDYDAVDVLLDGDVLHMLCEALGAVRFLYASCCRQWFDAARTLQGDDTLWKEACTALSPLLTSMHSPDVTWKELLKQRRLADRRPVAEMAEAQQHCHDYEMSFELIDSATNAVLRHGTALLADTAFGWTFPQDDTLCRFEVDPLYVGVNGQTDFVQLEALRLSLYLACDSRMCCLVRNHEHDNGGWEPWFNFECKKTMFHVELEFIVPEGENPAEIGAMQTFSILEEITVGTQPSRGIVGKPFYNLVDLLEVDEHNWVHR